MSDLDGRVIAIAGAGGGLGPAVAAELAGAGATLALTDRDQSALDALAADLGIGEERIDTRVVDLLDEPAATGWAKALEERFGHVDGLLHLVGGWKGGEPLATFDLADYELLHDLLVRTVIHTTRAFHDALSALAERPLRPRLLGAGAEPRRNQRRLRRRRRRRPRPGRWRSPTRSARRSRRRPRTCSSSTRS